MNPALLIIYATVMLITSLHLTFKSRTGDKFVTFIISYWILAHSVLGAGIFTIRIGGLPFDLQAGRIIFLLFISYILILFLKDSFKNTERIKILKHEFILFLYVLVSVFVSYLHDRDVVSGKEFILMKWRGKGVSKKEMYEIDLTESGIKFINKTGESLWKWDQIKKMTRYKSFLLFEMNNGRLFSMPVNGFRPEESYDDSWCSLSLERDRFPQHAIRVRGRHPAA